MEPTFQFELEEEVFLKNNPFVVIGRSEFINQPLRYMIQPKESFNKDGFNFTKGQWRYEHELRIIQKDTTNEKE